MIPLALIAARGKNGVIGKGDALPWRLKSDLKRFKELTLFKPVIMGRKTWASLPVRPLPGRLNLVLSRDLSFEAQGAVVCERFDEAVDIAREQAADDGAEEVMIIGGAEIYALALPRAQRLYLTEVDDAPDGDASFPAFDEAAFTETQRLAVDATDTDEKPYVFRILERR